MNGPPIYAQLQDQADSIHGQRRESFLRQLTGIRFLARQGLALRGHDPTEGNLHQLLKLQSNDLPSMQTWMRGGNYLSADIVNECINLMGQEILRGILRDIGTKIFAIMADETRDVSGQEQMAICLRWVSDDFEIHEDLIDLYTVHQTDSQVLTSAILDTLVRCDLSLSRCRGQCYDGAANMTRRLRGVAAQIRARNPAALNVHCFAHCLNLCLQVSPSPAASCETHYFWWEISSTLSGTHPNALLLLIF